MANSIRRAQAVPRNQGVQVPGLLPTADWCDSRSLAAGVAELIAPPSDADDNRATIFRINSTAGPLYINWRATATVPAADTTNGASSIMIHSELGAVLVSAPDAALSLSIICAADSIVTIEAWG